jgi:hypothetical protein
MTTRRSRWLSVKWSVSFTTRSAAGDAAGDSKLKEVQGKELDATQDFGV